MDLKTVQDLLSLPRIEVVKFSQSEHEVLIWVRIPDGRHRCPRCGRLSQSVAETREFKVRDLPISGKDCYLIIQKGRLHCPCSYRGYEEIEFVDDYQRQTTRFDEFLFTLCDRMTIMDAAGLLKVNWKRAYQVDKYTLENLRATTPLPELYAIGVDEISFKKRHRYFTLIYDLTNPNGVLFAAEGRSAESLSSFFKQLPQDMRNKIKVVSMDMWEPYTKAVAKHLPQAAIVYDRFHLKKHLNECLDELRRAIVRQSTIQTKSVIKGSRWVLLKNKKNHSVKEQEHLAQLRRLNSPLYDAYLLKEDFDQFFQASSAEEAKTFLDNWISSIPEAIYSAFQPFVKMLKRHLSNILTYFKYRYTNAIAEGINNKIKVLKRMAYGYRDKDYFKLKIYRKCGYLKGSTA